MLHSHFSHYSTLMAKVLLANRPHGARQLHLDYQRLFRRLASAAKANRAVEIGAFEAGFSRWWMRGNPGTSAIAYEANPYVAETYAEVNRAAGVDYRHACVADKSGEITFDIPRDFRGSERQRVNQMSSLMSNLHSDTSETVTVRSVRLDEDIDLKDDDRILMWVDVEGALGRVLPHMEKALTRTVMVNIEVESEAIWQDQWLDTDTAAFFEANGFVFVARDFQRPTQYNAIFVNPELMDMRGILNLLTRFHSGPFPDIAATLDAKAQAKDPS